MSTPAQTPSCNTAEQGCGCGSNVPFDGMAPGYKRVLWIVIAINAVMFFTEMAAGHLAGSQAL
jgi:Co/Zn/Cd efflux system component